jgi:hypothetical protein
LNAFASDALVQWITSKLEQQGVQKVIPDVNSWPEVVEMTRVAHGQAAAPARLGPPSPRARHRPHRPTPR